MRRVVVLGLLLLGCTQTPQEKAQDVCKAYCDCAKQAGQVTDVQDCIDNQCLPILPPVTDPCLDCVYQHDQTCTDLDQMCTNLCLQPATP